jgi:hypothetical protein
MPDVLVSCASSRYLSKMSFYDLLNIYISYFHKSKKINRLVGGLVCHGRQHRTAAPDLFNARVVVV